VVLCSADRLLFESPAVQIGAFRCPVGHPDFADSGPIRNYCFAFPRTSFVIRHKDGQPFPADPTIVTLYNKGQEYRRQAISPDGDRCDWYGVSEQIVRDAVAEHDRRAADHRTRPLAFARARVDAGTYLQQRQLFAVATRDEAPDQLLIEELVVALLDRVLEQAYGRIDHVPGHKGRRAADDLADAACELLGRRFAESLSVAGVADALDTSVYHLCRSFRRATGTTLHEHRNQLRLRSALDRLESGGCDLSELALDLGYSSHSHFTAAFRQTFGVTPSAVRGRVRASS
jgi:AraC family transcriptional regulator